MSETESINSIPEKINFSRPKSMRVLSIDWNNVVKGPTSSEKIDIDYPSQESVTKILYTGSIYRGKVDAIGMTGLGLYYFPHGVRYEGYFDDGMFHGDGTLIYPAGHKIVGVWSKGELVSFKFIFPDGLEYSTPWDYCKWPDRRFHISRQDDLQPTRKEYLTNEQPTRKIPPGCYDCGEGFYDPKTKCVISPDRPGVTLKKLRSDVQLFDTEQEAEEEDEEEEEEDEKDEEEDEITFLNIPTKKIELWIMKHCRKEWDEPTQYQPDLYEYWTNAKEAELQKIEAKIIKEEENKEEKKKEVSNEKHKKDGVREFEANINKSAAFTSAKMK